MVMWKMTYTTLHPGTSTYDQWAYFGGMYLHAFELRQATVIAFCMYVAGSVLCIHYLFLYVRLLWTKCISTCSLGLIIFMFNLQYLQINC